MPLVAHAAVQDLLLEDVADVDGRRDVDDDGGDCFRDGTVAAPVGCGVVQSGHGRPEEVGGGLPVLALLPLQEGDPRDLLGELVVLLCARMLCFNNLIF